MSWSKNLEKLTTKGGHDLGELMVAVKVEMFSGVVSDTRVDTGRLKGNWQIQQNGPAGGETENTDKTPKGSLSVESSLKIEAGSPESGLTYFVNNLPYAVVYEELDGMVRRNIIRVMQNIKFMAKKIKG